MLAILVLLANLGQAGVFAAITNVSVVIVYMAYLMVTVPALLQRPRGRSLSDGWPILDLGMWGIPVNVTAVVKDRAGVPQPAEPQPNGSLASAT